MPSAAAAAAASDEVAAAAAGVPPRGDLAPPVAAWRRPHTPGPLTPDELELFWTRGFVVKRGIVPLAELAPAVAAVQGLVDDVARELHAAGRIADTCAGAPWERRIIEVERQFPHASVLLHKRGVLPPGIAALWAGPALMGAARQLLGDDLAAHPVWNLRVKTPGTEEAVVPWHQDCGYLDPSARTTLQATAWVPLVPATRENGCMELLEYGHRSGAEARHACCVGGTWYVSIADGGLASLGCDAAADSVVAEVAPGDVLFLNNLVPHRSLPNTSDGVRWSLDLRWQRPGEPDGFYGLKPPLVLAKADDPSFVPDWAAWATDARAAKEAGAAMADPAVAADVRAAVAGTASGGDGGAAPTPTADAFDTVIAGPWMGRWERVHHNRHVDAFERSAAAGANGSTWHGLAAGGAFG